MGRKGGSGKGVVRRESVSEGGRWNTDQLVGNVSVVSACHTLTNGRLHQTRERWKHIDRWVYLQGAREHITHVYIHIHVHTHRDTVYQNKLNV